MTSESIEVTPLFTSKCKLGDTISNERTITITGLSELTTVEDLRQIYEEWGCIEEIHCNSENDASATITFKDELSAARAAFLTNGRKIHNKKVTVFFKKAKLSSGIKCQTSQDAAGNMSSEFIDVTPLFTSRCKPDDTISNKKTITISGLSEMTTVEDLRQIYEEWGCIEEIHCNSENDASATITFKDDLAAARAAFLTNGKKIHNKKVRVFMQKTELSSGIK